MGNQRRLYLPKKHSAVKQKMQNYFFLLFFLFCRSFQYALFLRIIKNMSFILWCYVVFIYKCLLWLGVRINSAAWAGREGELRVEHFMKKGSRSCPVRRVYRDWVIKLFPGQEITCLEFRSDFLWLVWFLFWCRPFP